MTTTYRPRDLLLPLLIWTAALIFFCCALTGGCGGAAELPDFRKLPGWRKTGQCYPFARAYRDALNDSGTPAVRVTYDWSRSDGRSGRHCVVLFKLGEKLWAMDNEHLKPWQVHGHTDLEMLGVHRTMVNILTLAPREPQTVEELFPDLTQLKLATILQTGN